jgi:hypothetical protein
MYSSPTINAAWDVRRVGFILRQTELVGAGEIEHAPPTRCYKRMLPLVAMSAAFSQKSQNPQALLKARS